MPIKVDCSSLTPAARAAAGARFAGGAGLEKGGDRRRLLGGRELRFRDGRAFAHRAGGLALEAIADRRAAAGAMAAADVLGHAGEAFLAREHRMRLVHRMQDRRDDDAGDPVELRRHLEINRDAEFLAFMAQCVRDPLAAGKAGSVIREDRRPGPRARAQLEEEALPAGPILRRAAYDDVGEFLGRPRGP
jgi:hypothetical protein